MLFRADPCLRIKLNPISTFEPEHLAAASSIGVKSIISLIYWHNATDAQYICVVHMLDLYWTSKFESGSYYQMSIAKRRSYGFFLAHPIRWNKINTAGHQAIEPKRGYGTIWSDIML
jgi:hypothetical protein